MPLMMRPSAKRPGQSAIQLGDWVRVVLMGSLLAAALFYVFFHEAAPPPVDAGSPALYEDATPVPELDQEILAEAHDATRSDRLVTDIEPLKHLLEKSLAVTPSLTRKLGMPSQPVSVDQLRRAPDHYRGKYLWYKGELEYLSKPMPGHPVPQYRYYEGRLRTVEDEQVLFAFSVPPSEEIEVGDWVRMEGYFLKLRDAHFPVELDRAPMLVGPELFSAYADWEAVAELDPNVLDRVRDGDWSREPGVDGVRRDSFGVAPDIERGLEESQDVPLWHLASYAQNQKDLVPADEWKRIPPFVTKRQLDGYRTGSTRRGSRVRILGTFAQGKYFPARPNPLGIETWSEVWVQIRDLGGKTVPLWIPKAIESHWRRGKAVNCNAYYFRRYQYTTREGDVRWTPLFVASELTEFRLPENPLTTAVTAAFAGIVALVGLGLFFLARRDRRQRARFEQERVDRRRRQRSQRPADPDEQPCAP